MKQGDAIPPSLKRITTEYVVAEDRIRLTGLLDNNQPLVIWLTTRLCLRLLPVLTEWLEQRSNHSAVTETVQRFAQEVASARLRPQPPVTAPSASGNACWVAQSIGVSRTRTLVSIVFRNDAGQEAGMALEDEPLRQWLSILYQQWQQAEWPKHVWPAWFDQTLPPDYPAGLLH